MKNLRRYHQYLKERFSLLQFVTLAGILSVVSSIATQKYLYGAFINFYMAGASFVILFLFLFRLRLFDEFKDYHHDKEHYQHRPVPRGLVTLKELKMAVFVVIFFEFVVAVTAGGTPFLLFLFTFGYSLLMFKEFFVQRWLRRHFTAYIASHEIILIPLFFYIYAINGLQWTAGLALFFCALTAFLGGQLFLLEVTRKVRPLHLEIKSKDTYTAQYGVVGACVLVLTLALISISSFFYLKNSLAVSSTAIDFFAIFAFILLGGAVFFFLKDPTEKHAKNIFHTSIAFFVVLSGSFILGMII